MTQRPKSSFFPDQELLSVSAIIPDTLGRMISQKAEQDGVSFAEEAGHLILLGIESERQNKEKINNG